MRSVLRLTVLVGMLLALGVCPAAAGAVVFSNNTPITINDDTPPQCDPANQTPATPYPSPITVTGLTGTITDVNVTLTGLTHTFAPDLRVLLVGPQGQTTLLMHEVGGAADVINANLTFDDAAPGFLPAQGPIVSGTYKPTQADIFCTNVLTQSPFPATAPAGPYGTTLAGFNGTNPNGAWNLYVVDIAVSDVGSIAGWSLDITTDAPYAAAFSVERLALSGRTLSFRMIAPAKVRFTLDRRITPKRYRRVGSFVRKARRGRNRVRIPRKLNGKRVKKGVYRLSARSVGGGLPSGPLTKRVIRLR